MTIGAVSREDVELWIGSLCHLAPGTTRTRFSVVKGFFSWLVEQNVIERTPFVGLLSPKVPRSVHRNLDTDAARAVLAVCRNERERCIVTLGLQLGLRRAEIAGLQVGDVNRGAGTIFVTGKGGHQRIVPMTAAARRAIDCYLAESPTHAGPLIRGDRYPTRPVSPVWVGRLVTRLCWEAGVKRARYDGISTHALRHTAASDTYLSSRDVLAVRDMLGHVSLATTEIYVRGLDVERLREAMEGRTYG